MLVIKELSFRNTNGMTLPFALILTFIFSGLVAVSYLFVSVNISQMQSSLLNAQAIAISEGINERVKARLNTKTKIQASPKQEAKLKSPGDEEFQDEEDTSDEDLVTEDDFSEETESFDEYYADEVLKISRFITFREPPKTEEDSGRPSQKDGQNQDSKNDQSQNDLDNTDASEDVALKPEANVEKIGDIDIPRGTVLKKGIMILLYKDEKIDLNLKDVLEPSQPFKQKLPLPIIKSLIPNYSEADVRSSFVVSGENLIKGSPRFTNKDIQIEDVTSGPNVKCLIGMDVMPGLVRFYWEGAQAEFYIIPAYDGSPRPVINEVRTSDGNQLLSTKAGSSVTIMIYGYELNSSKSTPVVIPDVAGIVPKVQGQSGNNKEITVTLKTGKNVELGIHSFVVATEGGLSNSWIYNIQQGDKQEEFSAKTATYTSGLTLLDIKVVENLLPLIDEKDAADADKQAKAQGKTDPNDPSNDDPFNDDPEPPESKKLSPFANADLETSWLLQTTCMVGKATKTISEVIHRQIPNVFGGLVTNSHVEFDGGGYQILGTSNAMTTLTEPTYISNTILKVVGPPKEPEEPIVVEDKQNKTNKIDNTGRAKEEKNIPKSPIELGFTPGSLVSVYKEGSMISDLDYAVISKLGRDTIELVPPGLMDFHYEGDQVFQFIPPVISSEKVSEEVREAHLVPKDYSVALANAARFKDIFRANLEQFSELADLYTNDPAVPKDEYDLPLGYMGLSYVEATPSYGEGNPLTGKGILIIDTRGDNQGRPTGDVELVGDSKNPIDFTGIVYVRGNVRIEGNVNINGALIVDNDSNGKIEITSNALGMVTYEPRAIKQALVSLPFATKPGTVMISNKPINVEGYIQSGKKTLLQAGASSSFAQTPTPPPSQVSQKAPGKLAEEALIETEKSGKRAPIQVIDAQGGPGKSAEEDLVDLF